MDQAQATAQLENHQEGETFTVLDPANLPTEATFPKVPAFAAGGLFGGLALGLLIVAFIEYKDIALRTERDVWELTHLPTLAVIAYSAEVAAAKQDSGSRVKRIFGRKPPKEALADV
jgi:capsular polysaccharide biosynthesis protein